MEIHADDHIVCMAFSAVFLVLALLSTQRLGKFTIIRWLRHSYIQLRRHTLFQRRTVGANMDRCVCVLNFTSFGDVLVFECWWVPYTLTFKVLSNGFWIKKLQFSWLSDLEFAQVSLPSEYFLQYTVVSREWNFLPRIMWLRGSKKSSQVKKKAINWKIEAIRGTKKMIWG